MFNIYIAHFAKQVMLPNQPNSNPTSQAVTLNGTYYLPHQRSLIQEDSDTNIDPSSLSARVLASSLRFSNPNTIFQQEPKEKTKNEKSRLKQETRFYFCLNFFWPKRNGCETTMTRNRRWKETFTEKEKRLKSSKITFVLKTL